MKFRFKRKTLAKIFLRGLMANGGEPVAGKCPPWEHDLVVSRISTIFPASGINLEILSPKTVDKILQSTKSESNLVRINTSE